MQENNPFKILNEDIASISELSSTPNNGDLNKRIKSILNGEQIVLFMKGNAEAPQCGFSANTVAILKHLGKSFATFNILEDAEVRQGLKEYSNWPTFPQLYLKGKLVGGNDILTEMFESGDLKELFNNEL